MDNNQDVNNVTVENTNNVVAEQSVVQQQNVESSYTSLAKVEPEVLGDLRKDKIGKPKLVLVLALLFALVLGALPILNNMLNDTESVLYKFLYESKTPGTSVKKTTTKSNEWVDGNELQLLDKKLVMMSDYIVMKDFKLSNGKVECAMYSYNGELNLYENNYYLEVYSNSKELHSYYKLEGILDSTIKNVVLERLDTNYNTELKYFGKIVKKEDAEIPEYSVASDPATGLGNMTCTKGNNVFVYTFKNDYLVKIANTDKKLVDDMAPQVYLNLLADYRTKAQTFAPYATVEEVEDGFVYNATLDLEAPGYVLPTLPEKITDSSYYKLDTKANIVRYAMIGKGFDCK